MAVHDTKRVSALAVKWTTEQVFISQSDRPWSDEIDFAMVEWAGGVKIAPELLECLTTMS